MSPFAPLFINYFYSHGLPVYYLEHKVGESPPPLVEVKSSNISLVVLEKSTERNRRKDRGRDREKNNDREG